MLPRLARTGIASALHWTGADQCIGILNGSRDMPLVLGYHRVVEDFAASAAHYMPGMVISRRMLERHLDWLGRRFRFVSLDELGSRLEGGKPFTEPAVALTFDDGYADVYHHAFPVLQRKGIPAGIFVVTDLLGTPRLQIYDKLYLLLARALSRRSSSPHELARLLLSLGMPLPNRHSVSSVPQDASTTMRVLFTALPQDKLHRVIDALEAEVGIEEWSLKGLHPLSWEMISEMHRAGMTIGSHTRTHALLTNESQQKVLEETSGSRRELEKRLGIAIKHFVYPDGRFSATVVRTVAASGYRFAYTTCRHRDSNYPLLTIPRILLWENSCMDAFGRFSSAMMSCQTNRVFGLICGSRQDHKS